MDEASDFCIISLFQTLCWPCLACPPGLVSLEKDLSSSHSVFLWSGPVLLCISGQIMALCHEPCFTEQVAVSFSVEPENRLEGCF